MNAILHSALTLTSATPKFDSCLIWSIGIPEPSRALRSGILEELLSISSSGQGQDLPSLLGMTVDVNDTSCQEVDAIGCKPLL